ncbi:MAG: hypothetical protein ACE5IH_05610, partial [Thermodesulfobacteriota bacterium]
FDAGNFALCFNCHNVQAFTDDDGIVGVQMTNFLQDAFGCRSPKRNLHATHLTDLSSSFPWGYINNMYTACANCHYNVHSNAEATNTLYGNGSGGGLPADGDTHLINFSPIVDSFNFSKPRWAYEFYFGSWYMRCNLKCHGAYMGYGSGFPSNADALYTRYPS